MDKLSRDFYSRNTLDVAKELLGKILVHNMGSYQIKCIINDVEAYTGIMDKACHSFGGRRTSRTEILWGEPGYSYIYMIYGMYFLLNVVTEPKEYPCAVLIRGVVPIEDSRDFLSFNRYQKEYNKLSKYQVKNLSNGPGKVCKALKLNKDDNGIDLLGEKLFVLNAPEIDKKLIKTGKRINIDYSEEAKDFLYRFYID